MPKILNLGTVFTNSAVRSPLTENLTLHVRADGDDSNDGRTESTAFATIQAAIDSLCLYDCRNFKTTIDVGPGYFDGFTVLHQTGGGNYLHVQGAGEATRIGTNASGCSVNVYTPRLVNVRDMLLENHVYVADYGRLMMYGSMVFEPAGESVANLLYTRKGGQITVSCEFVLRKTDTALSAMMYAGGAGSAITIRSPTVFRFENQPVVSRGAVRVGLGGVVNWNQGCTVSGDLVGPKYRVDGGGWLDTGSLDPDTVMPGDKPGSVHTYGLAGLTGQAQVVGFMNSDGNIRYSSNVATCTRTDEGTYAITFCHPCANTDYAVLPIVHQTASTGWEVVVAAKTADSVTLRTLREGVPVNGAFSFALYW